MLTQNLMLLYTDFAIKVVKEAVHFASLNVLYELIRMILLTIDNIFFSIELSVVFDRVQLTPAHL